MSFSARSDFYSHVKCDGIRSSMSMFLPFKGVSISSRRRNSEIKCVQNNAGRDINDDDDDVSDESTLSASIEQGKRIVALQKELLYQVSFCNQTTFLLFLYKFTLAIHKILRKEERNKEILLSFKGKMTYVKREITSQSIVPSWRRTNYT